MSKLRWVGYSILIANTVLALWLAWRRYALASELDTNTTGVVVSVHEGSGRAPADRLVASYDVGGQAFTVQGSSSDDSSLSVRRFPVDAPITVYYSSENPSRASLTRAGFGLGTGTAALLLLVTGVGSYLVFFKHR